MLDELKTPRALVSVKKSNCRGRVEDCSVPSEYFLCKISRVVSLPLLEIETR